MPIAPAVPRVAIALMTFLCFAPLASDAPAEERASPLRPLVRLLGQVEDAAIQRDVLAGIHAAVEGRRSLTMPEGWPEVAHRLRRSSDARVRQEALALSLLFGDAEAAAALRAIVTDPDEPTAQRTDALRTLVQSRRDEVVPLLHELLNDQTLCSAALNGLAAFDDPTTPRLVLHRYAALSAAERSDAIATLASRPAYALALLQAVEAGGVPSRDISAFAARQLMSLGDERVTAKLEQEWGSVRATAGDKTARVAELKTLLTADAIQEADRSRGRQVYARTCGACHRLFDDGGQVGPDLTGSQRTNLDYLLTNLIDPNALVGNDYKTTVIVTQDGRSVSGMILRETPAAVTLRTPTDTVLIPQEDIELRRQLDLSLMPEGIVEKLSEQELRDLVAYLSGPAQAPLSAP